MKPPTLCLVQYKALMVSKKATENLSPDKASSTSSLVVVAEFPGTVPVTVPGWFLFLLSLAPVTTFQNGFLTPKPGSCYSPHSPQTTAAVVGLRVPGSLSVVAWHLVFPQAPGTRIRQCNAKHGVQPPVHVIT